MSDKGGRYLATLSYYTFTVWNRFIFRILIDQSPRHSGPNPGCREKGSKRSKGRSQRNGCNKTKNPVRYASNKSGQWRGKLILRWNRVLEGAGQAGGTLGSRELQRREEGGPARDSNLSSPDRNLYGRVYRTDKVSSTPFLARILRGSSSFPV